MRRNVTIVIFLLSLILNLIGCSSVDQTRTPSSELVITEEPSRVAIATFTPEATLTTIAYQTETPTIKATTTPALLPTLPIEESENRVKEFLETNGECSLPCFWGIKPGETSAADAINYFQSLGWRGGITYGTYYTSSNLKELSLVINVGIYPVDNVSKVRKLLIDIGGNDYENIVKSYAFSNILSSLGKPTQILVFVGVTPGFLEPDETSFELLLFYREQNLLIEYTGTAIKMGENYEICPDRPNARSKTVDPLSGYISIFIGERGDEQSTPSKLVQPFWELPGYYISSDKAFELNVEQFYEKAMTNLNNVCYRSSTFVWKR